MKGKPHKGAYESGMRGSEKAQAEPEPAGGAHDADPMAYGSGMRGGDKPAVAKVAPSLGGKDGQATAQDVAQSLQPGTNTEGIAQGVEPPIIDAGDHYQIPKAHLVDGGDHYKLPKKKAAMPSP